MFVICLSRANDPRGELDQAGIPSMTVLRGFVIVAISTVLCAIVGAAVGWTMGTIAPSYYRTTFRISPGFDPVEFGFALGLTQGMVAGLVVGCVIVLAVAWYNSRRQVVIMGGPPDEPTPARPALGESEAF